MQEEEESFGREDWEDQEEDKAEKKPSALDVLLGWGLLFLLATVAIVSVALRSKERKRRVGAMLSMAAVLCVGVFLVASFVGVGLSLVGSGPRWMALSVVVAAAAAAVWTRRRHSAGKHAAAKAESGKSQDVADEDAGPPRADEADALLSQGTEASVESESDSSPDAGRGADAECAAAESAAAESEAAESDADEAPEADAPSGEEAHDSSDAEAEAEPATSAEKAGNEPDEKESTAQPAVEPDEQPGEPVSDVRRALALKLLGNHRLQQRKTGTANMTGLPDAECVSEDDNEEAPVDDLGRTITGVHGAVAAWSSALVFLHDDFSVSTGGELRTAAERDDYWQQTVVCTQAIEGEGLLHKLAEAEAKKLGVTLTSQPIEKCAKADKSTVEEKLEHAGSKVVELSDDDGDADSQRENADTTPAASDAETAPTQDALLDAAVANMEAAFSHAELVALGLLDPVDAPLEEGEEDDGENDASDDARVQARALAREQKVTQQCTARFAAERKAKTWSPEQLQAALDKNERRQVSPNGARDGETGRGTAYGVTLYSEARCRALSAQLHHNLAFGFSRLEMPEDALVHCNEALKLQPDYVKALLRRAALREDTEDWSGASQDLQHVMRLSTAGDHGARQAVTSHALLRPAHLESLEQKQKDKFEKEKEEMIEKLKDLGNMVLGKFGMNLDQFKLEQQPGGGYSISMNQGTGGS